MTTALELPIVRDGLFAALKPGLFDLKLLWRSYPEHYNDVIEKFQNDFMNYFKQFTGCNKPLIYLEKQILARPALLGDQTKGNSFILRMTEHFVVQQTPDLFSAIQVLFKLEYTNYLTMKRNFGCTTFFDLDPKQWVTNQEDNVPFQAIVKVIPITYYGIRDNYLVTFVFRQAINKYGKIDPNTAYISEILCPDFDLDKADAEAAEADEAIRQVKELETNRSVRFELPAAGGGDSNDENDSQPIIASHSSEDEPEAESDDESEAEAEAESEAEPEAEPEADSDLELLPDENTASNNGGQYLQQGLSNSVGKLPTGNSDTEVPGVSTPASSNNSIISLENWRNRAMNGKLSIEEIIDLLRKKKTAASTSKKGNRKGKNANSNLNEAIDHIKKGYDLYENIELRNLIDELKLTKKFGL